MRRQQRQEPTAFRCHFLPLGERVCHLLLTAGICFYTRREITSVSSGDILATWYRIVLAVCVVGLILVTITQLIFPVTTISAAGIRRHFAVGRTTSWQDIADFSVGRAWGVRRVYVQLLNGRKRRLDGVPPTALPALRQQLGIGQLKVGSWWLVDYS